MKQEKELQNELSKISENVNSTLTSLEAHESHVAELTDMIFSQNDGPVKSELLKVLTNANKHVSELQDHIKEGKELVKTKETQLSLIQSRLKHKIDPVHIFAEAKVPVKRTQMAQAKDEKDREKRADKEAGVHIDYLEVRKPAVVANATAPAAPANSPAAVANVTTNATAPATAKAAAPHSNTTKPAEKAATAPVSNATATPAPVVKNAATNSTAIPSPAVAKPAAAPSAEPAKAPAPVVEKKAESPKAEAPPAPKAAVQVEESKKVKTPEESSDDEDEETQAAKILNGEEVIPTHHHKHEQSLAQAEVSASSSAQLKSLLAENDAKWQKKFDKQLVTFQDKMNHLKNKFHTKIEGQNSKH